MKSIKEQLDPIFKPESIAIIGASNSPLKWGGRMLNRPLRTGYRGAIYPVNPNISEISGLRSYRSILDIPKPVDLAIMTIPAHMTPQAMDECVQKGVKGVILITAGYSEIGKEGKAIEDRVAQIARAGQIRLVGPNCMGLWSSSVRLNLSFELAPSSGPISFISQSGTFGVFLSEIANSKGYGLSKFVSIGNQADLTAADYLEYFVEDEETGVIVFYIEGFKDGRRFFELAKDMAKIKPILIFKAGRTDAGSRAAMSHTASLAGSDEIFDSACRQAGLIRTDEAVHAFDMADALTNQPLPPGRRVAILGSGGMGVVTADACASLGLEVPHLEIETVRLLQKTMPPHAPLPTNPIDFAGSARTAIDEASVVEMLLGQNYIDGVISNVPINPMVWSYMTNPGKIPKPLLDSIMLAINGASHFASLPRMFHKPIITMRLRKSEHDIVADILKGAGIPIYDTPEECARSMLALVEYAEVRRRSTPGTRARAMMERRSRPGSSSRTI